MVPGSIRAGWMVRQAASLDLGARVWAVTLTDLVDGSLDTVLRPLDPRPPPSSMRRLLKQPHRLLLAPVGSRTWLELLAACGGGVENGAIAP